MHPVELQRCLDSLVLLVDTREQPTPRLEKRLASAGLPNERIKLDVGDYSCRCTLPDGRQMDFSDKAVVERKMDLNELCTCFGRERARFEREFQRAREVGCKVYLLVENGSWEKVYNGGYKSRYAPAALVASINAFRARYGMQIDFCRPETTGHLIRDILYRVVKECLEGMQI